MIKLNHYQKDILIVIVIMVLQLFFTIFYPFRNPDAATDIVVTTRFIALEFEFVALGTSSLYLPLLAGIYGVILVLMLIQKHRRWALIYGFGLALVAKASYMGDLYALSGQTYTDLHVDGFLSQRLIADGEVLAQNITVYVLAVLLVVKIAIYVHDAIMRRKVKQTKETT